MHAGWDTCEYCRWEERGGGEEGKEGEGKVTWKTELNRIKKRYGLRVGAGREGGREVSVC